MRNRFDNDTFQNFIIVITDIVLISEFRSK